MEGSFTAGDRGVILSLRFTATSPADPRPEDIASVLDDLEGLYRAAPAARALGVPVADLLSQYYIARADAATHWAPWPIDPRALRRLRRLPSPELDEFLYLTSRLWRSEPARRYPHQTLLAPENAIRVSRLTHGSPLDLLAHIPADYWMGGGFVLFLGALERRFNMAERIRTERVDLAAKRAERRADEREAELREARAARQLEGLEQEDAPFQLTSGQVLPEDDDVQPTSGEPD
jgi:hypothetical protein